MKVYLLDRHGDTKLDALEECAAGGVTDRRAALCVPGCLAHWDQADVAGGRPSARYSPRNAILALVHHDSELVGLWQPEDSEYPELVRCSKWARLTWSRVPWLIRETRGGRHPCWVVHWSDTATGVVRAWTFGTRNDSERQYVRLLEMADPGPCA